MAMYVMYDIQGILELEVRNGVADLECAATYVVSSA